jgi:hypothetical protein
MDTNCPQMTKISIDLQGYYCNHWPWVIVRLNGIELFNQQVIESIKLDFDVVCDQHNLLEFEHYGKSFGANGVWDTTSELDCFAQIKDIRFDDVSVDNIVSGLTFISKWSENSDPDQVKNFSTINNCNGLMNFNGVISLEFDMPVYNWLIVKKYKKPIDKNIAYFSNHTARWHYEEDIRILDEIKNLMDIDENCCYRRP